MDDTNHLEMDEEDSNISDRDSDNEGYEYVYTPGDDDDPHDDNIPEKYRLDESTLQRLKQNDPSITDIKVYLHGRDGFFSGVDWKENGDCISNNTHLKRLQISRTSHIMDSHIFLEMKDKTYPLDSNSSKLLLVHKKK